MRLCPKCKIEMTTTHHPDIDVDICPSCQGLYLDKGELNVLVMARSHSVETGAKIHRATEYLCPNCGKNMDEASLLSVNEVRVERCPGCHGIFLDKDELRSVNGWLRVRGKSSQEEQFRDYVDEHLVTVKTRAELVPAGHTEKRYAQMQNRIMIKVYYKKELGHDFMVIKKSGLTKILNLLGMKKSLQSEKFSSHINKNYAVSAKDKYQAELSLGIHVQRKIKEIDDGKINIIDSTGLISLYDNGIVYTEGLYSDAAVKNLVQKSQNMIRELLKLAKFVERR